MTQNVNVLDYKTLFNSDVSVQTTSHGHAGMCQPFLTQFFRVVQNRIYKKKRMNYKKYSHPISTPNFYFQQLIPNLITYTLYSG